MLAGHAFALVVAAIAASPTATGAGRVLLLGRVVNLGSLEKEATVCDRPPDEELTDRDFGVVAMPSGAVEAYRLSTKERLWAHPEPYCHKLALGETKVYAECDGKLLAMSRQDGATKVLDASLDLHALAVLPGAVVALSRRGVVTMWDQRDDRVIGRKPLPLLAGSATRGLVVRPGVAGVCAWGTFEGRAYPRRWAFKLGCYDRRFAPVWTKTASFDLPVEPGTSWAEPSLAIRQEGPCQFVANDQPVRAPGPGRGKGLTVRWRDGQVETFEDHTFATVDDGDCNRLTASAALEALTKPVTRDPRQESFSLRTAVVAQEGDGGRRAFALVMNDATWLAGFDLAAGRALFTTPVPLGSLVQGVEVAAGFPVVRTKFMGVSGHSWRATVHDPSSGKVLYEDERPVR